MENNEKLKRNISQFITGFVAIVGIALVILFFAIMNSMPNTEKTADEKIKLNEDLYNELITSTTSKEPLILENQDFGRINPFATIK